MQRKKDDVSIVSNLQFSVYFILLFVMFTWVLILRACALYQLQVEL
jgi:hypothetical protein